MNPNSNRKLTPNAQKLRKEMTKEERRLWYDFLKKLPLNINRQKVFGKYILDFYCAKARTAIELDGSQHYEEKGMEADKERDLYLKEHGIRVLRYSNYEVNQKFEAVCEDIRVKLMGEQGTAQEI